MGAPAKQSSSRGSRIRIEHPNQFNPASIVTCVPNRHSQIAPPDPALTALAAAPPGRPVVLLHSGRPDPRWARRSLLAEPRGWFIYHRDRRSELIDLDPPAGKPLTGRLFTDLRRLLNDPRREGCWIGYISYDVAERIEPGKLTHRPTDDRGWPLVALGWCPDVTEFPAGDPAAVQVSAGAAVQPSDLISTFGARHDYEQAVKRVLGYIAAGDVFQVALTQRFTGSYDGCPRALFERLATVSPAWYGAYLELPDGRAICSTSPELFLQVDHRHIITRPIKGTRPAAVSPDVLRDSAKDAAELTMIVDLLRNDLGRVCAYGSVRVTEPRVIETHPTVHHAVATIEGDLHRDQDVASLLLATLPGGSITGAPKVRAMQIIDELEPVQRGPYCGCIGMIGRDHATLNIAIRTLLLTPGAVCDVRRAACVSDTPSPTRHAARTTHNAERNTQYALDFSVGGGIVADSDPAAEYDETIDKAQAMLRALHPAGPS